MASEPSAKSTLEEASTPVQSKRPTPKHKFEHEKAICSFVFLHDGVHIVSGSADGTMRKWNCNTGLLVGKPWGGKLRAVTFALTLLPDGETIVFWRDYGGSVQLWNTDGKMIKGDWTGHLNGVWSVSWSPSGDHISSGSYDGTIFIRKAKSGEVEVGPIETKQDMVECLAYSPSGDRIASGGMNCTICIWDTKAGELVVGPIRDLGIVVTSVVWSSDSTKIYSASDSFARIFDSVSGALLHRFEHDYPVNCVALSPKNNVLAYGTQAAGSLQPLGQPFHQDDREHLRCVSFSRDGSYLAYSGDDGKVTLWMVKDIAPEFVVPILQATQQETRPKSLSSLSCLDADTTKPSGSNDIIEEVHDDPYNKFFRPAVTAPKQLAAEGKVQAGEDNKEGERNDDFSANAPLDASKNPMTSDPTPSAEDNRNLWKWLTRAQGKELTSAKMAPAMKRAEIVEVYAVRGFQRLVAMKRAHKKKPLAATSSTLPAAVHTNCYSQAGATSQGGPITVGNIFACYVRTTICANSRWRWSSILARRCGFMITRSPIALRHLPH
ncbi:WD40-repeat-containing domain protein [Suillus paluster]|uniref:WD40-repeat-containing domain protein n=1 Tax=Suillus paluster TaxID=48578 RepID=UPI001B871659|nr:WD40-repeat-containing domain protein [Suillus paluster]KAG1723019.1 WD40-repeat-containing domain protein [Suillus paluster]